MKRKNALIVRAVSVTSKRDDRGESVLATITLSAAAPTYCHEVIPFSGNLVFRTNGTYPLPYGFTASANYANTPDVMDLAVWNVPQRAITGLNRAPSACTTNSSPNCVVATVPLIEPGTRYEARRNWLNLRFNKDVPNGLKPTRVMDARLLQLSARLDF